MPFELQYRRYRLPLRTPVRTAHEVWTVREGILIQVEMSDGRVGYGDIAPMPAFGTETIDQAEEACRALGTRPSGLQMRSFPTALTCVGSAFQAALAELSEADPDAAAAVVPADSSAEYRAVAALLPAGRAVLDALPVRSEAGFRVFKWKVGLGDPADEIALLDDVCAQLPSGGKLRLDANGAWDRRIAERWLERCAERPVEFVEQPCFAARTAGEASVRRAEDTLLGLAGDFPTPLALDESLVNFGDVQRWLGAGWPGWYVVKPSLLGDVVESLAVLSRAKATVVFSSALETAVGAKAALTHAFAWKGEPKALGFGVWPLFDDPRCDGPAAAPFIRREDVERMDPSIVWNALD